MKTLIKQLSGGWIFLILSIVLYIAVGLFDISLILQSLVILVELLQKIVPILIVVFFFIFLFNLFLSPQKVIKYLGRESGFKGWLLVIGGGIISMGTAYLWYPLLGDLKVKGMSNALIATFLYSRAIKIQLLPFLIYYFGWSFVIILTCYMIIFSVINGWLIEKIVPSKAQDS